MPPITSAPAPSRSPGTAAGAPVQRGRAGTAAATAPAPFSAIVLADPTSPLAEHIERRLTAAGARDIRYATSPADLLRSIPRPVQTGIGIICRSPRAEAVPQLVTSLRQRGWRRLVIACHEGDEAAIRLAIAAKVRCLILRRAPDPTGRGRPMVPGSGANDLSAREVEVLQAVADGRTNNEVGELLGLSGLTVKSHLARIGRKTGTGDRAEMVALAMRAGLVR